MYSAVLSLGTTATPQGFDMSLMWVPRGHVALASTVLEGILTECGPINGVLCSGNSSDFEDLTPSSSEVTSLPSDTLGREFDPGKRDFSH